MANYGDVALRLPANWKRSNYENQEQVLMSIGHEDGESDLYLKDDPDKAHQFRWIDPANKTEVTGARMRGWDFVKKDNGWVKRLDYLWEWSAEGFVSFAGQVAMFRPKERWLDDEARRAGMVTKSREASDREVDNLPQGLIATEDAPKRRRKGI